ncbi:MAG: DnaA/Hda family protein, partial [Planctomycetota bacterium]|nr:DnaA/Hda family protein [Planctomycetota bacterium]
MSCISAHDPQLARLADAIAQRVGQQRFHVWFNNSTRLDLKNDGLEIAVPNDFISEWIGTHFTRPIQEAAHEVLGCSLAVRFNIVPQLFEVDSSETTVNGDAAKKADVARRNGNGNNGDHAVSKPVRVMRPTINPAPRITPPLAPAAVERDPAVAAFSTRVRLRHDVETFVVGQSNQLAYNAALYVAEFPGAQYNPLFIHGNCGLGKTHLLQGLCKRFIDHHPTKRWMYLTGEEFTNEFLSALRNNKLDAFRRKVRDLDLLVIDDVHFLAGKKATQEEFLHTFNSIEAMGRQVVMASDNHPKMIEEFGESLINRFVSGMVVRIDPPNYATRCEILRSLS